MNIKRAKKNNFHDTHISHFTFFATFSMAGPVLVVI